VSEWSLMGRPVGVSPAPTCECSTPSIPNELSWLRQPGDAACVGSASGLSAARRRTPRADPSSRACSLRSPSFRSGQQPRVRSCGLAAVLHAKLRSRQTHGAPPPAESVDSILVARARAVALLTDGSIVHISIHLCIHRRVMILIACECAAFAISEPLGAARLHKGPFYRSSLWIWMDKLQLKTASEDSKNGRLPSETRI
jgi:hypothetical protein